ncbi:MAG: response regulator [Deltaproteobacteria bacterium]|nr:response regulator [Deltaproteobacteria bacterium]MBW2661913.1 response regulator [Deltaproteobacteria bacterium]
MQEIQILLVDDEDDFRTTLAKRLRLRKVDITDVASGNEAIELVKQKSFDVAVIDVKMPEIDGIETLKQVKQIQPTMEIVMLTGHASIESGMEAMKLGAYDYVMKPCDIDELLIKAGNAYQHKLLKEKEK